jgi:zinc transporter
MQRDWIGAQITAETPKAIGFEWIQLDWNSADDRDWLRNDSGIDAITANALLDEYTRARVFTTDAHEWVATLRAVVPADGEGELVSIRMVASNTRVITITRVEVPLLERLRQRLLKRGPRNTSSSMFVVLLCDTLEDKFTDYLVELEERADTLEETIERGNHRLRNELQELRLAVSRLRRHLLPQRDAAQQLGRLATEAPLDSRRSPGRRHASRWREIQNAFARNVEALHELEDRLLILQDTLRNQSEYQLNRTMYLLTLAATFFLPLTFIASLLGMNVPGIPAENHRLGFWLVCGFIAIVALAQWLLVRRWRLLNR